jgi:hypothetical protein
MRIIIALTTLVFGWCSVANAAEITAKLDVIARTVIITLNGRIGPDDYIKTNIAELMLSNPGYKTVLVLNSPGGLMRNAMAIGRSVSSWHISTIVADYGTCASGCALIWLAGTSRSIGVGGRVGFHSTSTRSPGGNNLRSDLSNAQILPYITELGYQPELYAYIVRAEPSSMTWLTQQDAQRYGIRAEFPPKSNIIPIKDSALSGSPSR